MPFPLNDAVIRDFDHVRVERIAARDGQPCRYKKVFKPAIGANGAELYWMQRENDFLLEFQLHKLPHTVRLASFNQTGGGGRTAVLTAIETLDAGVTLLDWLNLSVRYDGGPVCQHPFQPLGQFLRLLQACLRALDGIHALGIVHCDLKPDNLCLPNTPYPCQAGPLAIDFDKLALIDFAFALSPQRPLLRPLPVLPTQGYQAGLLKTALRSGQGAQQQLDWRLDLYSLGYLADDILRQSLIVPPGNKARATMAGAERLVATLLGAQLDEQALAHCDTFGAALPGMAVRPWFYKGVGCPHIISSHDEGPVVWHPTENIFALVGNSCYVIALWDSKQQAELFACIGHTDKIRALAFSPDGRVLASASLDKTVRLWSVAEGYETAQLKGHTESVIALAFSPDGKTLASGSYDNTVRLWAVADGRRMALLPGHEGAVYSLAFSPDGTELASASLADTVRLWSVAEGRELRRLEGNIDRITLAFKYFVAMTDDRVIEEIAKVTASAFSPDGAVLASGLAGWHSLRLWGFKHQHKTLWLEGAFRLIITAVAFSPDGKTLAAACNDETVRLWSVADGREIARLQCSLRCIEGNIVETMRYIAFSADGAVLALVSDRFGVWLWTLDKAKKMAQERWKRKSGVVTLDECRHIVQLQFHETVTSIAFSPDGAVLASGSHDKTVRLWNVADGRETMRLLGHEAGVTAIAFSPDGATLASASYDNMVRLWAIKDGCETVRLTGHKGEVNAVAFGPNSKTLATASWDRTVRLWDVADGRETARLEGYSNHVKAVAFSPNGKTLALVPWSMTIRLWDVADGRETAWLEHESYVSAVAFSSDGKTLASASQDKTVWLWNVADGRETARMEGHECSVNAVTFNPDGKMLASGSCDKTVRLWDVADWRETARLEHESSVNALPSAPMASY